MADEEEDIEQEAASIMKRFTRRFTRDGQRHSQMKMKLQNLSALTAEEDSDSGSLSSRSSSYSSSSSAGSMPITMPAARSSPSYAAADSSMQDNLRRFAQRADADAKRYTALLETAKRVVTEVKSALYDADHYGHGYGAEVLLEDAEGMLTSVANNTLAEAAQLQRNSELSVTVRQKMADHLKANHQSLEGLIRRRTQDARAENEERRSTCEKLWQQIRDGEAELENLPQLKQTPVKAGSPSGGEGDLSERDPVELCGLTLAGAHSLLRAFAAVLRPHIADLMPKDPKERSPAETIALEFLTAADATASPRQDGSEEQWEDCHGGMRRIQSSPTEIMGRSVVSQKPKGLISLRPADSFSPVFGRSGGGGNAASPRSPGVNSEAEALMKALGESY